MLSLLMCALLCFGVNVLDDGQSCCEKTCSEATKKNTCSPEGCESKDCKKNGCSCIECPTNPIDTLHLEKQKNQTGKVLLYDHGRQIWKIGTVTGGKVSDVKTVADMDSKGLPLLDLGRQKLWVGVYNTNANLYQIKAGAYALEDDPQLAELESFLKALNGALVKSINLSGMKYNQVVQLKSIENIVADADDISLLKTPSLTTDELAKAFANTRNQIEELQKELNSLKTEVSKFETAKEDVLYHVSFYEQSYAGAMNALSSTQAIAKKNVKTFLVSLRKVITKQSELSKAIQKDIAYIEFLKTRINISKPAVIGDKAKADAFLSDLEFIDTAWKAGGQLEKAFENVFLYAKSLDSTIGSNKKKEDDFVTGVGLLHKVIIQFLSAYDGLLTGYSKAKLPEEVQTLRTNSIGMIELGAQISGLQARINKNQCYNKNTIILLNDEPINARQSKVLVGSLIIKKDPALAEVTARRSETVDKDGIAPLKYKIKSIFGNSVDFSLSLTSAEISKPTFSVIPNPSPTPDMTDDNNHIIVLQNVQEDQAGPALFFNWRFVDYFKPENNMSVRPGIELGVGTNDDQPLFVGLSLSLGKYFRVGYGRASYKIDGLLQPGQVPASFNPDGSFDLEGASQVKKDFTPLTRSSAIEGDYWSFSIALKPGELFRWNK